MRTFLALLLSLVCCDAQWNFRDAAFLGAAQSAPAAACTAPSITGEPVSYGVTTNSTATFSVTATGTATLSYQWYTNGVKAATSGRFSGATASAASLTPTVIADDAMSFTCRITNGCGWAVSAVGKLTVTNAPAGITLVSGHLGGTNSGASITASMTLRVNDGANVTSGNTVIVGAIGVNCNGATSTLVKASGSGSIETITKDFYTNAAPCLIVYRVPITGDGTLNLTFTPSDTTYIVLASAEFAGLTSLGEVGGNSGTGTSHSSGAISTNHVGVICYVSSELSNGDYTPTYSDSLIYAVGTGASTVTGMMQYKIITTGPNTLTNATGADSSAWGVAYATYK